MFLNWRPYVPSWDTKIFQGEATGKKKKKSRDFRGGAEHKTRKLTSRDDGGSVGCRVTSRKGSRQEKVEKHC